MKIILSFIISISVLFAEDSSVELVILGTIQDGGAPHIGCEKECCKKLFLDPDPELKVVSIGLIDHENKKKYIFEATPDFTEQSRLLLEEAKFGEDIPDGIFLTHAHIGHYTGLMYLGREAKGASNVPVYSMPKMRHFLENNGPWSQLVKLKNIDLINLNNEKEKVLTDNLTIIPIFVPHRDEFSETVGFKIIGPNKSALFIPDIDKWEKWDKSIVRQIKSVDYAFLDATFYSGEEINSRDISEIPHPFVIESIDLFADLPEKEKSKIYFIHFNHTNPLIKNSSLEKEELENLNFNVAEFMQKFDL